ncbi:MAG: putative transposase YbfD/YdcC [Oleiphilaceae bacterium]
MNSVFSTLADPRSHINRLHLLNDIILIGIVLVLCGAETWKQMVQFGKSKESFFRKFLLLSNEIPSEDTINRVFSSINNLDLENCFIEWINSISTLSKGHVIAIDGKTIRGAKSHGKKSAIHMVSAWACENNLVLGQIKMDEKSNEITAIPSLPEILDIEGSIITIDAMGCQKEIAKTINDNDVDYILAVKENQAALLEKVQDEFLFSKHITEDTSIDGDHGRIETRGCSVITDFQHVEKAGEWKGLNAVIKNESKREFKNFDKPTQNAVRYYISSCTLEPCEFQTSIRSHWGIENKLHWVLDVGFSEDASRKRNQNSAQNYSILLKIVLNLLKNEKTEKQGVKGKRLKAGWDEAYLLKVLGLKV